MLSTEILLQYANDVENIPGKFLEYTLFFIRVYFVVLVIMKGSGIKHQIFNIYRGK